ncbi:hypothetical protein IE81DRAFT_224100 [Ceraceosorus guamensis]|uniref:Uncharacterized protein n=1 Tax=Ceraceosorus guamensis TaxID=1522189 RepID=A0A316W758_9BASI|nr:hypothetical protein IE81DRAFT_224100 [Ceraceosorus guamensis]PWN44968.1 hypothetical protein IE81DRAFT_224100 [Ceraceosorus guamensis]
MRNSPLSREDPIAVVHTGSVNYECRATSQAGSQERITRAAALRHKRSKRCMPYVPQFVIAGPWAEPVRGSNWRTILRPWASASSSQPVANIACPAVNNLIASDRATAQLAKNSTHRQSNAAGRLKRIHDLINVDQHLLFSDCHGRLTRHCKRKESVSNPTISEQGFRDDGDRRHETR